MPCKSLFIEDIIPTVAKVGLDSTFYKVDEDVGTLKVCAAVKKAIDICHIQFPFNISLSTRDGSAGK